MPFSMPHGAPSPAPSVYVPPAPQPRYRVVERVVRHRSVRGQLAFAQQAKERLPSAAEVLLGKSHRGLHLMAQSELHLQLPLAQLREAYGAALHVGLAQRGEPLAEVRIGLEQRHVDALRAALARRGVQPTEEYVGVHHCVLRFDSPASRLFGLPQEVAALTRRRAAQQLIVTGYA